MNIDLVKSITATFLSGNNNNKKKLGRLFTPHVCFRVKLIIAIRIWVQRYTVLVGVILDYNYQLVAKAQAIKN